MGSVCDRQAIHPRYECRGFPRKWMKGEKSGQMKTMARVRQDPCFFRPLPLSRDFYDRDPRKVARELLGKVLVNRTDGVERMGRIVEVEAYLGPHDKAAHSSRGLTPRTRVMFGPPGHAYVFMIYGVHFCMNVVTEGEGCASAVLLRAVEPIQNLSGSGSGPGRLSRAMHIDMRHNGQDLTGDSLFISSDPEIRRFQVIRRPRVGVDYAGDWARRLLRYYIKGNASVSVL